MKLRKQRVISPKPNKIICQVLKCLDYLTDEGDPAWCYRAGQPAEVAVQKCQDSDKSKENKRNGDTSPGLFLDYGNMRGK
jgi:hypothetical protein